MDFYGWLFHAGSWALWFFLCGISSSTLATSAVSVCHWHFHWCLGLSLVFPGLRTSARVVLEFQDLSISDARFLDVERIARPVSEDRLLNDSLAFRTRPGGNVMERGVYTRKELYANVVFSGGVGSPGEGDTRKCRVLASPFP